MLEGPAGAQKHLTQFESATVFTPHKCYLEVIAVVNTLNCWLILIGQRRDQFMRTWGAGGDQGENKIELLV